MNCFSRLFPALWLSIAASSAFADTLDGARSRCASAVAKLTAGTPSLLVERVTESAYVYHHLRHPAAQGLNVSCSVLNQPPDLTLQWAGASPSAPFWELVARAGATITGAKPATVRRGAVDCHQRALKDSTELASTLTDGIRYECQAYTRDGGGTSITLYRPSAEELKNFEGD